MLDFVEPVEGMVQKGNCIAFIRNGEGSMGYAVYKQEYFISTADITLGYAPFLNMYVGFFITTVADKVRGKYVYNYKRSDTRLRKELLLLPVDSDGQPDWRYMEQYTKMLMAKVKLQYLQTRQTQWKRGVIDPAASLSLTVQRNILLVPFKGINAGNIIPHAVILHIAGRYYVVSVIDGKQDFFIIPVRREERPKWPLPLSFFFSPRAAFHLPGVPGPAER